MDPTARKKESSKPVHRKLPRLPKDAKLSKRPSLRPAIQSPYSNSDNPKIVYVSAKTPFLSAVKRVEKLLRLVDKRAVQSATTVAKSQSRKRKRGYGDDAGEDEIEAIARVAEKSGERSKEQVLIKGTGKAIQRVMELGVWFQQRSGEYEVQMRTGSVATVDDVTRGGNSPAGGGGPDAMDVDESAGTSKEVAAEEAIASKAPDEEISETRLRYMSVLEVAVSLQ